MPKLAAGTSTVIDLGNYRSDGSLVYTGRERGRLVRQAAALDRLDRESGSVTVKVPEDVFGIASSFFLGMFGASVRALGGDAFRSKYRFVGPNVDVIVEDGIQEAEKFHSPLA